MKSRMLAGGAAGAMLFAALAGPTAAAAATAAPAQLSVLHGIPGVPVDVWVNGTLTLDDFAPTDLAGPLALAAGTYSVAITDVDATSATDQVIVGPADLPLAAGGNYTVVAHLTPADAPTATLFTNDISQTGAGNGRLTVRHTAGAPAVDILAGGAPVITNLVNPGEQVLNLPAATVEAAVALTGTTAPVIGPAPVAIQEGVNTIVYAYGSAADGTLALAVQTIGGLHTPPAGIPAGQTGEAALLGASSPWLGAGAIALIFAAVIALVVTRSARAERR